MGNEGFVDIWNLFKEYIDKKNINLVAERYVDISVDYGVSDEELTASLGNDSALDHAINYYLDIDNADDDIDDEY